VNKGFYLAVVLDVPDALSAHAVRAMNVVDVEALFQAKEMPAIR
jgi:hypothetical protein